MELQVLQACGGFLSESGALPFDGLVHAYQEGIFSIDKHLAKLRMRPLDSLEQRKSQMIFGLFASRDTNRMSMQGVRALMSAVSPKVKFQDPEMEAIIKV
jgi:hypothetical protein